MARIQRGRHSHDPAGFREGAVVFLIGMRVNKPWRIGAWLPALRAMPAMLAELSRDPDAGLLGYTLTISPNGPLVVQYWRDVESLYAYASNPSATHRPAWAAFNKRARESGGAVGIWHETYRIAAAETMYGDMPAIGLGAAVGSQPVTAGRQHARERLAESTRLARETAA